MRRFILLLALLAFAMPGARGADAGFIAAPFDAARHWEKLDGGDIGFATYLGEAGAAHPPGQRHAARGSDIGTGTIPSTTSPFQAEREFPGIHFRGRDDGDWEYFYLRPHENSGWDSNRAACR